ncbi:MAG: PEP-CTERM sorting domain-containing protein [Verrucomicrobiota bacterium]
MNTDTGVWSWVVDETIFADDDLLDFGAFWANGTPPAGFETVGFSYTGFLDGSPISGTNGEFTLATSSAGGFRSVLFVFPDEMGSGALTGLNIFPDGPLVSLDLSGVSQANLPDADPQPPVNPDLFVVIPEPSRAFLVGLAFGACALRRRRG